MSEQGPEKRRTPNRRPSFANPYRAMRPKGYRRDSVTARLVPLSPGDKVRNNFNGQTYIVDTETNYGYTLKDPKGKVLDGWVPRNALTKVL